MRLNEPPKWLFTPWFLMFLLLFFCSSYFTSMPPFCTDDFQNVVNLFCRLLLLSYHFMFSCHLYLLTLFSFHTKKINIIHLTIFNAYAESHFLSMHSNTREVNGRWSIALKCGSCTAELEFESLNWVQAKATSNCLVGGGQPPLIRRSEVAFSLH